MKMISLNNARCSRRFLAAGVAAVTLSYSQSANAALISITDDGVNTTMAWSGTLDNSGLAFQNTLAGSAGGAQPNFTSDALFFDDFDMMLLNGNVSDVLENYGGWTVSGTFDDPSGDFLTAVSGDLSGLFFANQDDGYAAFINNGDGAVELAGTLDDNGFTAGQTLTFDNPNVSGDSGQLVFSTVAVPEPSSTLLLGLGGMALLLRRRK